MYVLLQINNNQSSKSRGLRGSRGLGGCVGTWVTCFKHLHGSRGLPESIKFWRGSEFLRGSAWV